MHNRPCSRRFRTGLDVLCEPSRLRPGRRWGGLTVVDDSGRSSQPEVDASGADEFGDWLARLLGSSQGGATLAERLERRVLGGSRCCTRDEIEKRSGVPPERTQRLWRALGFADVDDDDVVFTESDVEALRLMNVMVGSGVLDPGLEAAAVRAAGQALARLAEWELGLLNDYVRARVAVGEVPVDQATVLRFVETMLPMMEQLHSYIWRRHIAALTGRAMASNAAELTSNTLVVGFVDVVGYTRLARRLTEPELGRLIDRFDAIALDVVAAAGGRVVKTLGDEVMFVADDPLRGAEIGRRLLVSVDAHPKLPDVRIGMAWGRVLRRFGDVYGPVVNIASRLTAAAKPGTVLVDRELATALQEEPAVQLRRRRPISARGYTNLSS